MSDRLSDYMSDRVAKILERGMRGTNRRNFRDCLAVGKCDRSGRCDQSLEVVEVVAAFAFV
jgi:hypothetical protein